MIKKTINSFKKSLKFILLGLIVFAANPSFAQMGGNPFARPAPAAPAAAATPAIPAPALPPKLLEPDPNDMRKTFGELNLVAVTSSRAVLRDGDMVYYLRNGESFTFDGTKVKVVLKGNTVRLLTAKGNDEVYSAEVGNGVAVSRSGSSGSSGGAMANSPYPTKAPVK